VRDRTDRAGTVELEERMHHRGLLLRSRRLRVGRR